MDRFTACPTCTRLVGANAAGHLQRHDVPFTRRRNPKIPQPCPTIDAAGNTILEA